MTSPKRALGIALLCGTLGAALVLVSAGQVWSEGTASFAKGTLPVSVQGSDISGLPSALALVGLAAMVAVFAVRRTARLVVAGLLALCGIGTLTASVLGSRDTGALEEAAARASGLAESAVGEVGVTVWPYLSAGGGVLMLVAGMLALRHGRAWPSMAGSGRYERTSRPGRRSRAPAPVRVDPDRPEDLWKALDRGEDPSEVPDEAATGEAATGEDAHGTR